VAQNQSPVKVTARSMRFLGNEQRTVFSGDVLAISQQYTISADEVVVHLTSKNEITRIDCNRNVNFKSADIVGMSNKATLNQQTKTITLVGNVKVHKGENYMEGNNIAIQYETKEITINDGIIIFNPNDKSGMTFTPVGN
jgi:lipopolysaccharide transport protein LptA